MVTKSDLESLAEVRLQDSILLLRSGRSSSAYYLAGYSIELALKACIAKTFQPNAIPDKELVIATYTHNIERLLGIAGLEPLFRNEIRSNPRLGASWGIVTKWTEESRYEIWDSVAATTLITAISDPANGVFQWLKNHW